MSVGYEPRWDIERPYGEEGERLVADVLALPEDCIEVKRKRYKDFSFYVETEQSPGATGEYKPSGIFTTEASYWAYLIDDTGITVLVPAKTLFLAATLGAPPKSEDDGDNPTRGHLVSAEHLFLR